MPPTLSFAEEKGLKSSRVPPRPPPKKKHFAFSTRSFFPHLRSKSRKKGYLISLASKFPPLFILAYVPEYGSRGGHFWPWVFCAKKYTRIQSVLGGRRDDIYLALFSFHGKRTLIWPPQDGGPKGGGESNPRLKLLKERGRNLALFLEGGYKQGFSFQGNQLPIQILKLFFLNGHNCDREREGGLKWDPFNKVFFAPVHVWGKEAGTCWKKVETSYAYLFFGGKEEEGKNPAYVR